MWRLLFEGQITRESLKNIWFLNISLPTTRSWERKSLGGHSDFVEKKVNAGAKYTSQYGPGGELQPEISESN